MIAPPTRLFTYAISNACFFDGNLHWVVGTSDSSNFIMTFSLTTRVFGTIELPKNWRCWGSGRQLTIIKGRLAVIGRCFSDTTIWVMEKYGKGNYWFISYKLDTKVEDFVSAIQPITYGHLLLYAHKERKIYDDITDSYTKILAFRPHCCDVEMETFTSLDYDEDDDNDDDDDEAD
ncbi:putative F-box domain-containing protein [Tanacetum coccineum]